MVHRDGSWVYVLLLSFVAFGAGLPLAGSATRGRPLPWPTLEPAAASDRILIVAPHVDDESIAAAGFLADGLKRGAEVFVVYLTAGDNNRTSAKIFELTFGPSREDLLKMGQRRIREARLAMSRLGVPAGHLFHLGYPDRGLEAMLDDPASLVRSPGTGRLAVPYPEALSPGAEYRLANLQADLRAVLERVRPTLVLLPVDFDGHPDHRAAGRIALPLLWALPARPRALGYLVHARDFPRPFLPSSRSYLRPPRALAGLPWVVFPLSVAGEALKGRVLSSYRSQRADPYLLLLTNAFIRKNELFLPLEP